MYYLIKGLLLIHASTCLVNCYSQCKVVVPVDSIYKILYNINSENLKPVKKGFLFPEVELHDQPLKVAFKPKLRKIRSSLGSISVFEKTISPVLLNLDSTWIYLRHYLKNTNEISIWLHTKNGCWYKFVSKVEFENYQIPIQINLSRFVNFSDTLRNRSLLVDRYKIELKKKNENVKTELVIGDFRIFNRKIVKENINHPMFDPLHNTYFADFVSNSFLKIPSTNHILSTFSDYCTFNQKICGPIELKANQKETEYTCIKELFNIIIESYPFYKEKTLDKNEVLNKFNKVLDQTKSSTQLLDSLEILAYKFNDPHFRFYKKNENVNVSQNAFSLYPAKFGDNLYISAVFDTIYDSSVVPGAKIISINKKPIAKVLDSMESLFPTQNTQLSFNNFCDKNKTNIIGILKNKDTITFELKLSENLIIPSNYKPQHGELKIFNNTIGYYRLNFFRVGDYLRFINNYEFFQNLSGLIIDLRNNSGGYGIEAQRIVTCFIKSPKVYSHREFKYNRYLIKESQVISPNINFNLSQLKIAILINENTACASEIFTYFLSKNANAIIIGTSSTRGTLAHAQDIIMPTGRKLRIDCLDKHTMFDNTSLETIGISPNIYVSLNYVKDLYPYEDKVLSTAIKTLSEYDPR